MTFSKIGKNVIAVAKGDGIGPEIMEASLHVLKAPNVPLDFKFVDMGKSIYLARNSPGKTKEAKELIKSTGIFYKGPMETPKGSGVKSMNVTARKHLKRNPNYVSTYFTYKSFSARGSEGNFI